VSSRSLFGAIALLAAVAGALLWGWMRPAPALSEPSISPAATLAASFRDTSGGAHTLGEIRASLIVVNFWATWCAPCREEMPALSRTQARWRDRGVAFVGIADDDPGKVERFAREFGVTYPLWLGGDSAGELSRRLGNRRGVLPHTAILGPEGQVLDNRVGPYTDADLDAKLRDLSGKIQQK
jgi:thiol-disulfide isomerase/thioredoxin